MNFLRFVLVAFLAQATPVPLPVIISGVVVERGTGKVMPGAVIQLNPLNMFFEPQPVVPSQRVAASEDGTFRFAPTVPANYSIKAYSSGSRGVEYSGFVNSSKNLRFEMMPPGVITGHVQDVDGKPLSNAPVTAMTPNENVSGVATGSELIIAGSGLSNEFGEYRIENLLPGVYLVYAASSLTAPVFFPSANDIRDATMFELRSGEIHSQVDFRLLQASHGRIHAAVVEGSTGNARVSGRITLIPQVPEVRVEFKSNRNPDGSMDFQDVVPGRYYLLADAGGSGQSFEEAARRTNLEGKARVVPVDVKSSDSVEITIVVSLGIDIPGRTILEGTPNSAGSPASSGRIIASLSPDPSTRLQFTSSFGNYIFYASQANIPSNFAPNTPVSVYGDFVIRKVQPGNYKMKISGLYDAGCCGGIFSIPDPVPLALVDVLPSPPKPEALLKGMYVKSIRMGSLDLSSGYVLVGGPSEPLEILLGTDPAKLTGQALNEKNQAVAGATVVAIPDVPFRGRDDMFRFGTTSAIGNYDLELGPGDYKLFAFQGLSNEAWRVPAFLRLYEDRGTPLHVDKGVQVNLDLAVIAIPH